MRQPQTPQTKKRLSLLKDCQYIYGENNKSSRKSIRWRKRWVNSTYRRNVKQSLWEPEADLDRLIDCVSEIERHPWKKCADIPLGEKLLHDRTGKVKKLLSEAANADRDYLAKLARYLNDRNLKPGRVAIIIRRVRAVVLTPAFKSATLDLTWEDLGLLEDFLCQDLGIIIKRVRAVTIDLNSATLDLTSEDLSLLIEDLLRQD